MKKLGHGLLCGLTRCCAALALLLVPAGCSLIGGSRLRAASSNQPDQPAPSSVTFSSQPGQAGASATEFRVGQPIYAVAHLKEPAANLIAGDGNVPVSINIGTSGWGGIPLPLTDAQKNSQDIEFAIMSEDLQKQAHPDARRQNIAETFMKWLNGQPRGVAELTVTVGSSDQAAGTFKLDPVGGGDGYAAMVEANEKIIEDSTADTPIPSPAMTDLKLEEKIMAILKHDHPKVKYYKVIITSGDWSVSRNEATGIIEGRRLDVAALSQSTEDGKCAISTGLVIREEHQGGGKYGNTFQAPGGKSVKVPCERFASFGAPK